MWLGAALGQTSAYRPAQDDCLPGWTPAECAALPSTNQAAMSAQLKAWSQSEASTAAPDLYQTTALSSNPAPTLGVGPAGTPASGQDYVLDQAAADHVLRGGVMTI